MILELVSAGVLALKEYIALHVLTCLIPAFLLAGAMVSFISRESVIKYLGSNANKLKSFSLACVASFFVAACSCTVIPVASGIYYQGAGVGPAFIFLWVAPAANILAIIYTSSILGGKMVLSRIAAALAMAFVVGIVMSVAFRKEEIARTPASPSGPVRNTFSNGAGGQEISREKAKIISIKDLILLLLIALALLSPNYLIRKGPYLHKVAVWLFASSVMFIYALKTKTPDEIKRWLKESWWFVKIIFPLLLLGVFVVGVIRKLLPQEAIQKWLGGSGVRASLLATVMGQVMYFATMTEAPFLDTLMKLGMGRGPALALLLTGPGMSLPNMLAIARVFGFKKALVYIFSVMALGTFVGWFFGNFVF